MKIITRKEAKEQGLKHYFTGKACKHGHFTERHVYDGSCVKCRREYGRQWYKENKQKVLQQSMDWYKENTARALKNNKRWRKENLAKVYENARLWRIKHPEKGRERSLQWYRENTEKANATVRNRRARLNNAEGTHTVEDIQWLLEKQKYKCVYCKKSLRKEYHVDHIQPISKGGSNDKLNLQILCPTCNVRKHTKDPIEFAQSIGLLL